MRQAARWSRPGELFIFMALAIIGASAYFLLSARTYGLGFPLDDAWIHQTYARNLALSGEWAFIPGEPSGGSTAPLWSGLLALGYALRIGPLAWAFGLGLLFLAAGGWLACRWFRERNPQAGSWALWAGVLVVTEWHMLWAALSGMETMAISVLPVLVFLWLDGANRRAWTRFGLVIGLGSWLRPDALTLLLPVCWVMGWSARGKWASIRRDALSLSLGLLVPTALYLAFNENFAGAWWPSTFYAKQAEYAILRSLPIAGRLLDQLKLPLVGVGAVLLPGVLLSVARTVRRREWARLAPLIWVLAYLVLYAARLPVTYQHGRYAMPTIPVLLVLGWEGLAGWVRPGHRATLRRVLSRAWLITVGVVGVAFLGLGAGAYARDVAIIETEMVRTARWVAENTPPDSLVAAHDIGALGYYSDRRLLDLAGLISVEVIPFLRDEKALEVYLDTQGADFLVTFPGWYPQLVRRGRLLYTTGGEFSPRAGGENMVVYRWR